MEKLAVSYQLVSKRFGRVVAVDGANLEVGEGEVFGLLGPNGSGKSTLMKMAIGLVKPDSGSIQVNGLDVTKNPVGVKRIIGYVPEAPRLYDFLSGIEYLDFVADVYDLRADEKKDRITRFLNALQLEGREREAISGYSMGMKQKVAIISALIHSPKVLILDEPLNGLDPRTARIVKNIVRALAKEGVATIFSTHVLEIAEAVCDRIAIMHQGYILELGTAEELRRKAKMEGSKLEDVFLKLTSSEDLASVVEALIR